MNGPHDMGGFTRFGPINPEKDEPLYHAAWERRVFALSLAMGATGAWNIDMSRHARESRPALEYWASSYYEIWLFGLARLLIDRGLISEEELSDGKARQAPRLLPRVLKAGMVEKAIAQGSPADRTGDRPSRFRIGDLVRASHMNPAGHTRLPRYLRGHAGEIVASHGMHVYPDSHAHGLGEDPQWLYTVRFTARELWGHETPDIVHADLWETYLEPV